MGCSRALVVGCSRDMVEAGCNTVVGGRFMGEGSLLSLWQALHVQRWADASGRDRVPVWAECVQVAS